MRFITEFEIQYPYTLNKPYAHMERAKYDMGQLLQNSFDWKERAYRKDDETEVNRWVLEIEAFPMDKWMKFKSGIIECIEQVKADNYPPIFAILSIGNLLKELESFGKPSGDAITNLK